MLTSLKYYWPFLFFAAFLAVMSSYLGSVDDPNCMVIFGYSASIWSLIVFCFGFPLLVVIASIYLFYAGWHSIKQGVYPPSNFPAMGVKARTGLVAKVQALIALSFPVLAIGTMVFGTHAFSETLGGNDIQMLQMKLVGGCDEHVTSQSTRTW